MHYLIDGHNLIAHMPDISLDDPNDEIKLVLRLQSWAAARRQRRVTVIFDGGLPGGKSLRFSNSAVHVLFASVGRTADALLIKRIHKIKNPPEYKLVSSDQEIIAAATARRVPHVRSEAFAVELEEAKRPVAPTAATPDEADDPPVSEAEVAEWLALFGPVPERKTVRTRKPPRLPKGSAVKREEKKKGRLRDLRAAKTADSNLSAEEIDAWLDLFGES